MNQISSLKTSSLLFFVLIATNFITMSTSSPSSAAAITTADSSPDAAVHIVYTERPQEEEPDSFHIRTLASVVGSEEAAKEALIYSYKTAASGFSAKLTPNQVQQISKQPGVLQVVPSRTAQLHTGPGNPNLLH